MIGFGDFVRVDIAPISKKMAVKYKQAFPDHFTKLRSTYKLLHVNDDIFDRDN